MQLEKFLEEIRKQHIIDGDIVKIGMGGGMFIKRYFSMIEDKIVAVYREDPNSAQSQEKYTIERISQITKIR